MLAGPHPRSLRPRACARPWPQALLIQRLRSNHRQPSTAALPKSKARDSELLAVSRFQMRPIVITLLSLLLIPALAADQERGVPSKDGLVVCVSAPACDAGA